MESLNEYHAIDGYPAGIPWLWSGWLGFSSHQRRNLSYCSATRM